MGRFLYGTSSWSEKSWVGPFYPPGTRPADYLSYYATRFSTVEADVTYYRVPDPDLTLAWRRKVPADFRLAAKFPRSIVHGGESRVPDREIRAPAKSRCCRTRGTRSRRTNTHRCG